MILECKSLAIGYENRTVLKDINLTIDNGDYVCLFGDNGSGKSTLVKTLLGLIPKLKGDIIFSKNISQRSIGYLPQRNDSLSDFPASVFEVVRSGCLNRIGLRPFFSKRERKRVEDMMEILEIKNLEYRSFSELSGGQQQRVLLARALCATDKILVLDEPFTGLDGIAAKKLYETLDKINKELKVTLIIVSHFVEDLLKYANKVIHLSQECLFCGNPEEYKQHMRKEFILSRHQFLEVGDDHDN